MRQTAKIILVTGVGLFCTALGVLFRAYATEWSMRVISRQGNETVQQPDLAGAAAFTEVGLAFLLIGVALVLASTLSWLQRNETRAQLERQAV
jgi:hypothetical protein